MPPPKGWLPSKPPIPQGEMVLSRKSSLCALFACYYVFGLIFLPFKHIFWTRIDRSYAIEVQLCSSIACVHRSFIVRLSFVHEIVNKSYLAFGLAFSDPTLLAYPSRVKRTQFSASFCKVAGNRPNTTLACTRNRPVLNVQFVDSSASPILSKQWDVVIVVRILLFLWRPCRPHWASWYTNSLCARDLFLSDSKEGNHFSCLSKIPVLLHIFWDFSVLSS